MAETLPNIADDLDAHADLAAVEADLVTAIEAIGRARLRMEAVFGIEPVQLGRCAVELEALRFGAAIDRKRCAGRIKDATCREARVG